MFEVTDLTGQVKVPDCLSYIDHVKSILGKTLL